MDAGVRTLIPARIDRLPWSRFHTRMVVALGVAWILDGLEITVASAIAQCFGALGPVIYGALIGDGSHPVRLFVGYLLGAGVMIAGGLVARFLAVDAENKSLEDIALPLSATARRGRTRAEGAASPFST